MKLGSICSNLSYLRLRYATVINEETNKEEDFLTPLARNVHSLDEYVIGETNERMSHSVAWKQFIKSSH